MTTLGWAACPVVGQATVPAALCRHCEPAGWVEFGKPITNAAFLPVIASPRRVGCAHRIPCHCEGRSPVAIRLAMQVALRPPQADRRIFPCAVGAGFMPALKDLPSTI